MDMRTLQQRLGAAGHDPGPVDERWGPKTRSATRAALRGDPTPVTREAVEALAVASGLTRAHLAAVIRVECAGAGFVGRSPVILFEPHVFSRLTKGRFDAGAPVVSYPKWGARPYPGTQEGRYEQLLTAVGLDPGAAFEATSWGLAQMMGFNARAAGFGDVWAFVRAMCSGERAQVEAMVRWLKAEGLVARLQQKDWAGFARAYNGPGYAKNQYDVKLAAAYRAEGGR